MTQTINSSTKDGVGVFPHLTVKIGVINRALSLLKKLRVFSLVKEFGGDRNRFPALAIGQVLFDYVRLPVHGGRLAGKAAESRGSPRKSQWATIVKKH